MRIIMNKSKFEHKISLLISFLLLLNLNIGYAQPANSPWPMYHHDPQHTGRSPYAGPEVPNLRWTFSALTWIQSSVAIGGDGTLYVGSTDENLYAIHPDGTLRWWFNTGEFIDASPAIGADGTIYIASGDHNLYAINPDGTLRWKFQTGDDISLSPAIAADGTIYIGSGDRKVYAIHPDGSVKWEFTAGNKIGSSPAIAADGTVYAGSWDKKLYAINPDGTQKWAVMLGDRIFSSPSIGSDGTIYTGSDDDKIYAIEPNGQIKWSFLTGGNVVSCPAIGLDGTIYVGSFDHKLYAIHSDGTLKWEFTTGEVIWGSSPAIDANGVIYVGSFDNKLYAINPDGTFKWEFLTDHEIFASPAIGDDGTIYIGSKDGKLYAIGNAYILKRKLPDGSYEAFQVDKHGWRFSNLDGIDFSVNPPDFTNAILWPESWWSQFSYINLIPKYFFRKIHPSQWPKQNDFPDLPLIIEYYGESQCYLDWPKNKKIDQKVIEFWVKMYSPARQNGGWLGSCYGLAVSCFLAFQDPVKFYTNNKFRGIGEFVNLHDLDINDERRKVINGLFTYQFEYNQSYYIAQQAQKNPKEIVDDIVNMIENEQGEYRVLMLMNQFQSGQHSVNPYMVRRLINPPHHDIWEIFIYDNNIPDNSDLKIRVFNINGVWNWSYDMNPNDPNDQLWGGDKGLYLTRRMDDFYFPPLIPPKISAISKAEDEEILSEYLQFYNIFSSSIMIKDSKGKTIGFDDSVAFNDLEKGIPIISANGVYQPPIGYFLPEDTYHIEMNNYSDSLSFFEVFSDSTIYNYSRKNSRSTEKDYLTYDNGISFANRENILKVINLEAIINEGNSNKIYQTFDIKISSNDSIKINRYKNDQLALDNFSQDKIYRLRIISISADNEATFEHSDINLYVNSRHIINPDWENLKDKPIKIFIDENINDIIDDTLFIENQYTGIEEKLENILTFPTMYELMQNYPNPFNATTTIQFGLPIATNVKIEIYNMMGQHLETLLESWKPAGFHSIKLNAQNMTSGIYIYRIQAGDFVQTKKMILLK